MPASQGLLLWLETSAAPRRRPPRPRDLGKVSSSNEEVRRVADKGLAVQFLGGCPHPVATGETLGGGSPCLEMSSRVTQVQLGHRSSPYRFNGDVTNPEPSSRPASTRRTVS